MNNNDERDYAEEAYNRATLQEGEESADMELIETPDGTLYLHKIMTGEVFLPSPWGDFLSDAQEVYWSEVPSGMEKVLDCDTGLVVAEFRGHSVLLPGRSGPLGVTG